MTADQVIKTALEKLAKQREDAFMLGAYQMFKKAGASDAEAAGLVKASAFMGAGMAPQVARPPVAAKAMPGAAPKMGKPPGGPVGVQPGKALPTGTSLADPRVGRAPGFGGPAAQ